MLSSCTACRGAVHNTESATPQERKRVNPFDGWARLTVGVACGEKGVLMVLSSGTRAPDFTLKSSPDQSLSLSDLKGRPVVLVFYPADWSPVCGDELALFSEVVPEFDRYDARVIGISVDSVWCHRAYANHRSLGAPVTLVERGT